MMCEFSFSALLTFLTNFGDHLKGGIIVTHLFREAKAWRVDFQDPQVEE